ncbi:MAG: hypothetical protein ACYDBJ_18930 [Aggregatilineales bacterium]
MNGNQMGGCSFMVPAYYKIQNKIRIARCFARVAIQGKPTHNALEPQAKRRPFLHWVIGLWLTLVLLTLLGIAASGTRPHTPIPEIADYLLPDQPLPKAASCDGGDDRFRYMSFCAIFEEGVGPVYFTYDQQIQAIRSTVFDPDGLAIGDLIPVWGKPQSYRHDNGMIQVYWGRKSILLFGSLAPTTPVGYIFYRADSDLPQDGLLPWRGFVNVDLPPEVSSIKQR